MDPPGWGFGSGWHFCQIFGSGWPLVRWTPNRWGFGSSWHFCQILSSGWPLVRFMPWQRHLVAKCVTALVRLTSGQIYPPWWGFGSGWHFIRLEVRLTFGQMSPPAETSRGQVCYYFSQVDLWSDISPRMRLQVRLTFSQNSGQAELCFFLITFPICDYKISCKKVVPWCSNTPGWWWKDMHKLVWTENSLDSISLHLV